MTLFGLSPWLFLVGAGVLAGAVAALHLLRVRLRRVDVDTLLFFRLAGAVQKPRVLPGAPARWLAFLLALLASLLAWTAVAAPRTGLSDASRVIVVEPDATTAAARVEQVLGLLTSGLGPRGMVLAATSPPRVLLRSDEPREAMRARAAVLATTASGAGAMAALRAAHDQQAPGDELVWLAAAPVSLAGVAVTHVPVARGAPATLTGLAWQRAENGELTLVARGFGLTAGELRHGGAVLAQATTAGGFAALQLGPFAPPTAEPTAAPAFELALAGLGTMPVPAPADAPVRVFTAPDLGGELARAVAAVLAVDGDLAPAADAAAADVVVAAADDRSDGKPRLVLTPGVGGGPRTAVRTDDAPVAVSLRDGKRRSAAALPANPGATVWIADANQGGALAASLAGPDLRRILVVDWLLLPITRADTPALLATALRELGGKPAALLAVAGQPLAIPAAFGSPLRLHGADVLPVDGTWTLRSDAAGEASLGGPGTPRTLATLAPPDGASPIAGSTPDLASLGGDGSFAPWLLLLLVLLLALDAMLFHRARLP